MKKKCGKVKFNLARVVMILAFIRKNGERDEKRYYKCDICKGYHLTSMSLAKYEKQKELFEKFLKEKEERDKWNENLNS